MKRKGWIAAAVLVCAGLVVTAPARAQDRYVPDTSKKVSLDDLARYLGVKSNKKILEEAVRAAATVNIDNRQYVFEDAITAYDKKDYAGTVRALERARLAVELDTWRKEAAAAVEQLKKLNGGRDRANELERLVRHSSREGAAYWLRNRSDYLAKLQTAKDWIAAEPERQAAAQKAAADKAAAEQKAAEERAAAIAAANAKGVSAADFEYDVTRDGKGIVIKRYKGQATVVNIPAVIEGFPVREIGGEAFARNKDLTSVAMPDSVTTIVGGIRKEHYGEPEGRGGVFENCAGLKTVTLSRSLKAIPDSLFAGCTSLEAVAVPNGVTTIGEEAFADCTGLKTVTLPNSLTAIGRFAFYRCTSLAAVTLPDSLTQMGMGAFMRAGLTSVVLPRNLKTLEGSFYNSEKIFYRAFRETNGYCYAGAFENCAKLESVTIEGNGVTLVRTFQYCEALTSLTINGNINLIDNGTGTPGSWDMNGDVFRRCVSLTTVTIGPKVTKIGNVDQLSNAGNLSIASKAALNQLR